MIKNIIFDLGNVILEFNGIKLASKFTRKRRRTKTFR